MRPFTLTLAATAALAAGLAVSGGSASAAERHCYTPHIGDLPSYEVCTFLPVDIEPAP